MSFGTGMMPASYEEYMEVMLIYPNPLYCSIHRNKNKVVIRDSISNVVIFKEITDLNEFFIHKNFCAAPTYQ